MKTFLLMVVVLVSAGCASTSCNQKFTEGAANCNSICKNNPAISEYTHKAGGGITLLFMGGLEEKCRCDRINK